MGVDNVDYFAKNIKYLRNLKGLKQGEVCAMVGFSTSTWSEYEHGWSKPRFDDLIKIFDFFEVTASELLEMDLSEGNPNEISELRKIVRKGKVKGILSGNLKSKNSASAKKVFKAKEVELKQLNRLEKELKELRSKLGG